MSIKYKVLSIKGILITLIFLASVLRLWNLNGFPAGFNADEAAIGYNAYSLIQTGKDEYGTAWPLQFKSFGDFKPGLYLYFTIPFVAFFGLNEWAVRLPSAILGIGTVILIYFLAKQVFQSRAVGLLASLFLAISPWHLHFSRGGWETNAATFFITLGVLLFNKGLENKVFLFWSMVSFLVSMYTYQSPRLIIPALLFVLIILYRQNLVLFVKEIKPKGIIGIFTLVLLTVPLIFQFTSNPGTARFSGLSFFNDPGPSLRVNELRGEHENLDNLEAKIIHNKFIAYGVSFLGHYLDHFRPDFLFITGDPIIRNKVPETGQFYLIYSVFLIFGTTFLIRSNLKHAKLLVAWILVAPLASSITYQTPHALRSLNMVIPLTLVMGYGVWGMGNLVKGKVKVILMIVTAIIILFESIHYLESYYIHYPRRYPIAWEYGFSEMVAKLERYESLYNKIVITDTYDQPYILLLFYKQYDPAKYQPQAILSPRDQFNFGTVRSFDKYEFRKINPDEVGNSQNLFVGTEKEIEENAKILDKVIFPNGEVAFIFAEGGSP